MAANLKILMYGWEFPPNISGGLGIACYAMVRSLMQQNIGINLILPESTSANITPKLLNNTELKKIMSAFAALLNSATINHHPLNEFNFVTNSLGPYSSSGDKVRHSHNAILSTWASLLKNLNKLPEPSSLRDFLKRYVIDANLTNSALNDYLLASVCCYAALAGPLASLAPHQIIHAHDWLTILAALEGRVYSKASVVMHVHALEVDRSGVDTRNLIFQIEQYGMEHADKIIAVSELTKNNIIKYYHIDAAKISVIHNGLLTVEVKKHLPKRCPMVLFLGRITFQKGPHYFIEIAEKVLSVVPQAQFVFAGSGDLLKSTIEEVAAKHLGANVHFTGFLNPYEVNQLFELADVYVMPSVSEPFGISALEAAQHRVPVIVSKQSGVTEVMPNILKIDFWDTDKFAGAIIAILTHQSLGKEMSSNAARDLKQLTWDNAAKKILKVYESLLK